MAYVVSAHKPTSVRHAISCSFLSPSSHNLILATSNILQIYDCNSTGQLTPVAEHTLHAKIISLAIHKPPHYSGQDHLFILTDNYVAFTCSWDLSTQQLRNEKIIDGLFDSALRPGEAGELVRCDPGNRAIGLSLYQGLLTFLLIHQNVPTKRKSISNAVPEGTILTAVSLRMKVLNLINFVFLKTDSVWPHIVVLWKDDELRRWISVWEVEKLYKASDRDFVDRAWANGDNSNMVDQGASLLIPTKDGGVIVVGEQTIAYFSMTLDTFRCVVPQPTMFECYTPVGSDPEEWILGDAEGRIYSLALQNQELTFTKLGETSIPATLVLLDPTTLFIGSHFADSLTVSLKPTIHPKQTVITNLAPISDFLVLPPSHPQSGALITCSGGFGQGTIRVVRQGVGIEDYAAVDFDGIRGIWTLSTLVNGMDIDGPSVDGVLVLGLIERTVFLEMDSEGGLEAVETVGGLIAYEETIAMKEVDGKIVQITTEQIHVTQHTFKFASLAGKVSAAQITDSQILVSSGRNMMLLSLECQVIQQWTLPEEITCLDIQGDSIVVGLWNSSVQLIFLSTNITAVIDSHLSAPARSIVLTDILDIPTLLIGSRDGTLTTYSIPPNSPPQDKKTVSLGTQPLRLFALSTGPSKLIFAASDRPTLIHAPAKRDGSKKLVLSALSLRDVLSLTPLKHPAYPEALVIATKEGFRIGKMDQMSRLQVRSVGMPGGELPRRIARMDPHDLSSNSIPGTGVVGVISLRISFDYDGSERTEGYLRVWDEDSWQCIRIDVIKFPRNDLPQSIAALELMNFSTDEKKTYFVVGSAVELAIEDEPREGWIRIYEIIEQGGRRRLHTYSEDKVLGSVYCLDECDGKLICGIGSTLRIYDLSHSGLIEMAGHRAPLTALTISTLPPFILMGDLMKSVTLLRLDSSSGRTELTTLARDYAPLWMTSVAMIEEGWFLGAEDSGNIIGWKRDDNLTPDEARLNMVHEMRFGEMINRIRPGSLSNSEIPGVETKALFATVDGTIGIVASLSDEKFQLLEKVEKKMEEQDMSLGGLDHSRWRAFTNGRKKALKSKGFIDGDFVETFLDLDGPSRLKCCEGIERGVDEVHRLIEELSRLH